MTKFSEVPAAGITIRESANDGSDFTNPAADYRRLFLGEDGRLHVKDSAGTVTDTAAAGDITTDTAWAAKGDLIVGTANNTAAVLTAGTNDYVLTAASGEATGLKWAAASGGGAAWPDAPPASPSAYDDEFTSALPGPWTAIGTVTASNSNSTAPSHLYLKSTQTQGVNGYYRACPSLPFTVITKVTDWAQATTNGKGARGLFIGAAGGAGKLMSLEGYLTTSGYLERLDWTNATTYAGTNNNMGINLQRPLYLRMIVNSSTSVDTAYSFGGFWTPLWNTNPGFTVAIVGLYVYHASSGDGEAIFDFIRFT